MEVLKLARWKRTEVLYDTGTLVQHVWSIFSFVVLKVFWWPFGALDQNWPLTREPLIVDYIWGTFGIRCSESFSVLVSKWSVTRKRLMIGIKKTEIGDFGTLVEHLWGTFDPVVFKVVWCSTCLQIVP